MKKRSPYEADVGAAVASSAGANGSSKLRKKPKRQDAREAEWFAGVQKQWGADRAPTTAGSGEWAIGTAVDEPTARSSAVKDTHEGPKSVEVAHSRQERKQAQV